MGGIDIEKQKDNLSQADKNLKREVRESRQAGQILEELLQFERILVELSSRFINVAADKVDREITKALQELSTLFSVDRGALWQWTENNEGLICTHVWNRQEDSGQPPVGTVLSNEKLSWFVQELRAGRLINIPSLDDFPPDAVAEKQYARDHQIKSLVIIPLKGEGRQLGAVGFASLFHEKKWSGSLVNRMRLISEIFANALLRKKSETLIEERLQFEKVVAEISAKFVHVGADHLDNAIHDSLRLLGEFFDVDRCLVFLLTEKGEFLSSFYSWISDHVMVKQNIIPDKPPAEVIEILRANREFSFSSPDDIPEDWIDVREFIETLGIRSVFITPILSEGKLIGGLVLESFRRECSWSDEFSQRVRFIGNIIVHVLSRKRAEEKIADSEERYRAIVQDQTELICRFKPDGTLTFVNNSYYRYFGKSAEDLIGKTFIPLIPDEDQELVRKQFGSLSYENPVVTYEHRVIRPDGEIRWQQWTDRAIFDERQRIVEYQAVGRDVTKRKQAEGLLAESEERFRQLAENIEDVFWLSTPDLNKILYVSPAYEKIWGRSCQSLYDEPMSWFDNVHPDDMERVRFALKGAIREETNIEYRIIQPQGTDLWIRGRSYPIRNEYGQIFRIAGVASDITEEKRLRRESAERLQQIIHADKMASLGQVVAGVAHELNNPNSFIAYNVPLLEETWKIFQPILIEYVNSHPESLANGQGLDELMKDMSEVIEAIRTGSERINRVITSLKDFSRIEKTTHTTPVQVNEVIERALIIVGAQLRKAAGNIAVNLPEDIPNIKGHFIKLEQVVTNLLLNAAQAITRKSEGKVSISTRYSERLRSVLIDVEDNGTGIDRDTIHRIFEPFFTTRRVQKGTGLGLSVSYGLIEEHHGSIGVLSRPGLGSRFTVFLPIDKDVHLDLNPTILCVESDRGMLNRLRSLGLKVSDRFISRAVNPEEVGEYLREHPEVDIVMSEIETPEINGWEMCEEIKSQFPLIAVILFSSSQEGLKRIAAGSLQPDYVVEKSVQTDKLRQIINSIGRM